MCSMVVKLSLFWLNWSIVFGSVCVSGHKLTVKYLVRNLDLFG